MDKFFWIVRASLLCIGLLLFLFIAFILAGFAHMAYLNYHNDKRKDFSSLCDLSYNAKHSDLKECVLKKYKVGDSFSNLKQSLIKENYQISIVREGPKEIYNCLVGQNRIFTRQILVEIIDEKIVTIKVWP